MMFRRLIAAALALTAALAGAANGQFYADTDYSTTEIVPERPGFVPGETTWFAVRQEVEEGWHVFWVNPGDAGIPLALDWRLPAGFAPGEILHPSPHYIPVGPLASYAHEGEPVFLVPVETPADAPVGEMIDVVIDAEWQVCEEICVPEEATFAFSLPVLESAAPSPDRVSLFAAARAALPEDVFGPATFARAGDRYALAVENWNAPRARDVFFFPVIEGLTIPAGRQDATMRDGVLTVTMEPGWTTDIDSGAVAGVIAYADETGARRGVNVKARIDGALAAPPASVIAAPANLGLLLALAFFGGLILNAMPCVFPILFIKAAAITHSAHGLPGDVKRDGLVFTGGVLTTFLLMGGLLLALRAGGEQLGWGFHLQSPWVVALSAYTLFLVGLNLAGLFTVGESIAGSGEGLARRGGAAGAFFTGALAVVVAAPCIGPLLSAPMGAALLQPPGVGMLIFALMALGLAAPFLALSFIPALGARLPAPGAWMNVFKQVLAFPVFAAAAYFVWIFARQTGDGALGVLLAGAILLSFAAWAFQKSKGEGRGAFLLRMVSALAVVAALAPVTRISAAPAVPAQTGAYGAIPSEPYSAAAFADLRAARTPVFIDFTAAWCVTCQFNKMTVLRTRPVADAFARSGTVLMVADWTVRDPVITAALQSYGASGVPLYVYYPPDGEAEILPQTLSTRIVVNALSGAGL